MGVDVFTCESCGNHIFNDNNGSRQECESCGSFYCDKDCAEEANLHTNANEDDECNMCNSKQNDYKKLWSNLKARFAELESQYYFDANMESIRDNVAGVEKSTINARMCRHWLDMMSEMELGV